MFISLFAAIGAGFLSILVAVFAIEVVAGFVGGPRHRKREFADPLPNVGLVVPAHDEGRNLTSTLLDLATELRRAI